MERQFQRLEEENALLQQQVRELQNQLAEAEQQHAQRFFLIFFFILFVRYLNSCLFKD